MFESLSAGKREHASRTVLLATIVSGLKLPAYETLSYSPLVYEASSYALRIVAYERVEPLRVLFYDIAYYYNMTEIMLVVYSSI